MKPHPIQQHILRELILHPAGTRYRDMKQNDIENDLYNYHLKQLVHRGLITKSQNHYLLTEIGKKYLIDIQPIDPVYGVVDTFKIAASVLLIVEGKVLYQTRAIQPFVGNKELIGGAIQKGESVTDAANRRLQEEAGVVANTRFFGTIRKIRYDQYDTLYSDMIFQVCFATEYSGHIKDTVFGTHEWLSLDSAINHEQNAAHGSKYFAHILEQIKTTSIDSVQPFYFEEHYRHNIY